MCTSIERHCTLIFRSGKISVDELQRVCSSLGTPITEQEITELLKEYAKSHRTSYTGVPYTLAKLAICYCILHYYSLD